MNINNLTRANIDAIVANGVPSQAVARERIANLKAHAIAKSFASPAQRADIADRINYWQQYA